MANKRNNIIDELDEINKILEKIDRDDRYGKDNNSRRNNRKSLRKNYNNKRRSYKGGYKHNTQNDDDFLSMYNGAEFDYPKNRSIPSKGWKNDAPRLVSERRELLNRCGKRCFLMPENLKFPICSKYYDCKINCSGINSANVRAGQYKYPNVQDKAQMLYNKYC